MATQRKFAISLTPNQPGYEATYSTCNDLFAALGDLDLVTLDQQISVDIFDDYSGATPNVTSEIDISGWVTSFTNDNFLEFRAAPGEEYQYPTGGASLIGANLTGSKRMIDSGSTDNEVWFKDLGLLPYDPVNDAQHFYGSDANRQCRMSRCFIRQNFFSVWQFQQVDNSIMHAAAASAGNALNGAFYSNLLRSFTLVIEAGASYSRGIYRLGGCFNVVVFKQAGATISEAFNTSGGSDYCASFDDTAVGVNSIHNVVMLDECVSESDAHLKATSQLRGAGRNDFGLGYDKDIDRDDRPNAAWDIGADQFVGVAPTPANNAIMHGVEF